MNLASVCMGQVIVILKRLHQGMKHLYGTSDIKTKVRFSEVQTGYIHLGFVAVTYRARRPGFNPTPILLFSRSSGSRWLVKIENPLM